MKKLSVAGALAGLALALVVPARGGGPLHVNTAANPRPIVWDAAVPVQYHPDQGTLGRLTNAEARTLVAEVFKVWDDVPAASLTIQAGSQLPVDVTATNYRSYLDRPGDGLSPIVFDTDGTITDAIFGTGNRAYVMGFAGVQDYGDATARILEAQVLMNGRFIDGTDFPPDNPEVSLEVYKGVFAREFGHFLGLDNSQLNYRQAFDSTAGNPAAVPTMFPLNVHAGSSVEGSSLHQDDRAALAALYPAAGFTTSTGTIEGMVRDPSGSRGFQGMNVVARRVDDPLFTAQSSVSGYPFRDSTGIFGTTEEQFRGYYRFEGLPPGNYSLEIEPISRRFRGDASVGPLEVPAEFPGVGEYWNGYNESASPALDTPSERTHLEVAAGQTISRVDFVLNYATGLYEDYNAAPPNDLAGTQLIFTPDSGVEGGYRVRRTTGITSFPHDPASDTRFTLGDDAYTTLDFTSTGLNLPIYGAYQTSVNICSNGFLTFGTPSPGAETDYNETVAEHMGPRPHVSALYDDLDPSAAGAKLAYGADSQNLWITFESVPGFGGGASSSFQYQLQANGTITITYLGVGSTGGLTGISSGGTFDSRYPVAVDFGRVVNDTVAPTAYIDAPVSRTDVSGTFTLKARAEDPAPSSGIRRVDFLLDGSLLGSDSTAPYELVLDTTRFSNGPREFAVLAFDNSGHVGTAFSHANILNPGAPRITQRVVSASRAGSVLTLALSLKNESAAPVSDLTLNVFWVMGVVPGGQVRMFANPSSGAALPRNLGSLAVGQEVTLELRCFVPAEVTSYRFWTDAGQVTIGGTVYQF